MICQSSPSSYTNIICWPTTTPLPQLINSRNFLLFSFQTEKDTLRDTLEFHTSLAGKVKVHLEDKEQYKDFNRKLLVFAHLHSILPSMCLLLSKSECIPLNNHPVHLLIVKQFSITRTPMMLTCLFYPEILHYTIPRSTLLTTRLDLISISFDLGWIEFLTRLMS